MDEQRPGPEHAEPVEQLEGRAAAARRLDRPCPQPLGERSRAIAHQQHLGLGLRRVQRQREAVGERVVRRRPEERVGDGVRRVGRHADADPVGLAAPHRLDLPHQAGQ